MTVATAHATRRAKARSPFLPTGRELANLDPASPLAQALIQLPELELQGGSLAVSDLPVNLAGVRTELTDAQVAGAEDALKFMLAFEVDPFSANTRRCMRSDWRHWVAFCAKENRVAMPIDLHDLCEFVDALIAAGYKRATIERLLFTLKTASELWSCPDPTSDKYWRGFWRDRRRKRLVAAQSQAPGLTVSYLDAIMAKCLNLDDIRSVRDCTMLACAYDLLTRSSELVAMRWDGIVFDTDSEGAAQYTIARSKTDQEARGETRNLSPATAELLKTWRELRLDTTNPFVFHALPRHLKPKAAAVDQAGTAAPPGLPVQTSAAGETPRGLTEREVARVLERLARRAGLEPAFSGHSARVGAAQDMQLAGMTLPEIMYAGRWKSASMPARYAAAVDAAKAGRKRQKALNRLRHGL